jgi:hypothetical protein
MVEREHGLTECKIFFAEVEEAFPCVLKGSLRCNLIYIIGMFDLGFGSLSGR